jgi:hypothetical protein
MSGGVRSLLRYLVVYVGVTVAILGWVWMIAFVMAYGD